MGGGVAHGGAPESGLPLDLKQAKRHSILSFPHDVANLAQGRVRWKLWKSNNRRLCQNEAFWSTQKKWFMHKKCGLHVVHSLVSKEVRDFSRGCEPFSCRYIEKRKGRVLYQFRRKCQWKYLVQSVPKIIRSTSAPSPSSRHIMLGPG